MNFKLQKSYKNGTKNFFPLTLPRVSCSHNALSHYLEASKIEENVRVCFKNLTFGVLAFCALNKK